MLDSRDCYHVSCCSSTPGKPKNKSFFGSVMEYKIEPFPKSLNYKLPHVPESITNVAAYGCKNSLSVRPKVPKYN